MWKDITLAKLYQSKFDVVGVSREVFKAVTTSAQKAKSFVKIVLVFRSRVLSSKLNRTTKQLSNQAGGSIDTGTFISNVVLHARLFIDSKLATFVHRSSKTTIILPSVFVVGIVFGTGGESVVDVKSHPHRAYLSICSSGR
jgi:hypothetical protein